MSTDDKLKAIIQLNKKIESLAECIETINDNTPNKEDDHYFEFEIVALRLENALLDLKLELSAYGN